MQEQPRHFVAVIGGAVSGSVAAEILADGGAEVVVIEQNDRPYG
jgi:flavin-dependent dehydrogenase